MEIIARRLPHVRQARAADRGANGGPVLLRQRIQEQPEIREVAGWGSPAMERIYTHLSPEHVASQLRKRRSSAFGAAGAGTPAAKPAAAQDMASLSPAEPRSLAERAADERRRSGESEC